MKKQNATKRSLLMSAISLLLCFSMLLGTTFAWFTDSVTSANNIIKSGNLDVEFYYQVEGQTDWTKVTKDSNIFKKDALWEPGYTEVVKLRVVNEGSLALKYQLGVNVASETGSTNVEGNPFKLSDYIKYGIVDGAQSYTRAQAIAAVEANANTLATPYTSATTNLLALDGTNTDNEDIVTLVVYMPETVGNEANHAATADAPVINLGINVVATQVEAELDSFGNDYDSDAPYSKWDGTVPTEMPASLVVDGATQTVHVKDAAAFAYLSTLSDKWAELYTDGNGRDFTNYANGAGANYYYSGQWTISLEADIDLTNKPITPVKIALGERTGASAFKGNNHTIRNINTTTGLFADDCNITWADFTLQNVKATRGALVGYGRSPISNVTVKNATISGTDYVGGLVGSAYSDVKNCKVIDSSVVASGKEAGGLIGYIETSSNSVVTNNTVKNVSVIAGNRAGGLIAQVNVNVVVKNNTVDTVTVAATDTNTYQPGAVVSNALAPANVYDNTVVNATVAGDKDAIALDETSFKNALKNATADSKIILAGDITVNGKWDNRYDGGKQNVPVTIDGCGNTLKIVGPIDDAGNQQAVFYFQNDAVVKNLTFDLSEATSTFQGRIRAIAAKGDLVVDNCTFIGNDSCTKGSGITYGMGSGTAIGDVDVTVTNCTFIDLPRALYDNEGGKDAKTLTFKNNKFTNSGINVSAGESITFTGNKLTNTDVRLVSYQNGDTVKVTATDNDLSASAGKVIAIMKVTNTANITKQDEFVIY